MVDQWTEQSLFTHAEEGYLLRRSLRLAPNDTGSLYWGVRERLVNARREVTLRYLALSENGWQFWHSAWTHAFLAHLEKAIAEEGLVEISDEVLEDCVRRFGLRCGWAPLAYDLGTFLGVEVQILPSSAMLNP